MNEPGTAFWRIHSPEYSTDYQSTFINGSVSHPYCLPGMTCEECGEVFASTGVVPMECPEALRSQYKSPFPVPQSSFRSLVAQLLEADSRFGEFDLRPGYSLQPTEMSVPSQPRADFFWSSFGSIVISERMRSLFMENSNESDVHFCPIQFKKIGKRNAKLPSPIPSSGEPIDVITEAPPGGTAPSYYEMVVTAQSEYPSGYAITNPCPGCGRPETSSPRRLLVTENMWGGQPIFTLATTLYTVITAEVRDTLIEMQATNIAFSPIAA